MAEDQNRNRSTRIAKLAAQDAATTALREVTRPFAENPEVGRLWRQGLEDLEPLTPEEKARFFHVAFQFLKAMETIHFHYIYGLMEEQVWRGWRNPYGHYLASPGLIYYWQLRHDLFSDRSSSSSLVWSSPPNASPSEIFLVGSCLAETQSDKEAYGVRHGLLT
jgi:hypothetical protein